MIPTSIKTKVFNILSIICACHLFFAGLDLPESYYTYLSVVVCSVALLTMVNNIGISKVYVIAFGVIAVIFNPIAPMDFNDKAVWVLLDIITALLFLIEAYDLKTGIPPIAETKKIKRLFRYKLKS